VTKTHRDVARRRVGAQPRQDFVAIHLGHHHVEQDEIRPWQRLHRDQAAAAGIDGTHAVVGPQKVRQHRQIGRFVIDDQKGVFKHGSSSAKATTAV